MLNNIVDHTTNGKVMSKVSGDDVSLRAWRSLLKAHSAAVRRINALLHERGALPLESYDVLLELFSSSERRLRLRDLGERVVLTRSGISRLVTRLEDEGLVERASVPGDARGVYAQLTRAGEAAFRSTWPVYAEGIEVSFGRYFSDDEAGSLAELLERIP